MIRLFDNPVKQAGGTAVLHGSLAPNGAVIHASGGNYSQSQIVVNEPIALGQATTYEDLVPHIDKLMDMSAAKPRERRQPRPRQ